MKLVEISPFFQDFHNELSQALLLDGNLYVADINKCLNGLDTDVTLSQALSVLHQTERLLKLYKAGLLCNAAVKQSLESHNFKTWDDYEALGADPLLQRQLADKLYNIDPAKSDQVACLRVGFQSDIVAQDLFARIVSSATPFFVDFVDEAFHRFVVNNATDENVALMGEYMNGLMSQSTTRMSIAPNSPDPIPFKEHAAKAKIYQEKQKTSHDRIISGKCHFTLTRFPTMVDVDRDKIPYDQYQRLFFEMCDQPWDHIDKAHQALIPQFNAAQRIHITNDDGTDLRMNLITKDGKPFTFCNSLIAKNVPGSEIFSAPERESAEGLIVAKGLFSPTHDESLLIENLTLRFNKGKLVEFDADKGGEHFQAYLDRDEGNYYIGELGIGTNPHLKYHLINGLLVEKIGGSFHVALGASYTMDNYMGTPVFVDNGNRSNDHWDITTMLFGKKGRMVLDDTNVVMDNGLYTDPKLSVLNKGWQAVLKKDRPSYWQKKNIKPFTGPV